MTKAHNVLITGGAGYVGTAVTQKLAEAGHHVTVVDRKIEKTLPCTVWEEDYLDFFSTNEFQYDTIVHLAAEHNVPESIPNPEVYYTNNVVKMKGMLDHMVAKGIKNIVFSSTGNIYGRQGGRHPLVEDSTYYDPMNPYASSKVAGEMMIQDYARAYGIRFIIFRYFNVAGADPTCRFGYERNPATNVIPVLCQSIINNKRFVIYGTDYQTLDGTCVRDYVHLDDVARAHVIAMDYLDAAGDNDIFNIGGGRKEGTSVKELATIASTSLAIDYPRIEFKKARMGDPASLIANISKAEHQLGWAPRYRIEDMIVHAWRWENRT